MSSTKTLTEKVILHASKPEFSMINSCLLSIGVTSSSKGEVCENKECGDEPKNICGLSSFDKFTSHLQRENQEMDIEIGKTLWAQYKAKLTLASEQSRHFRFKRTIERFRSQMKLDKGNDYGEECVKRKQSLLEEISQMKREFQEKKREVENNNHQTTRIEQENLIMKKRNQAVLLRLDKQCQEAEFNRLQALENLRNLRDKLGKNYSDRKRGTVSTKQ